MKRQESAMDYEVPDLDQARGLLIDHGLPIDDVTTQLLQEFLAVFDKGTLMVMGGLEIFGCVALLRSVVTAKPFRGQGLAKDLVRKLEQTAKDRNVNVMFLITIDANCYFESLGYSAIPRDEVPKAIRETAQFSGLCPTTAFVMSKRL